MVVRLKASVWVRGFGKMHLPEIPVDEFFVTIFISYLETISIYINYHLPLM